MRKFLTVAVLLALLSAFTVTPPKEPVKTGFHYEGKVAMFDGKVIVEGVTINPKTGKAFAKHNIDVQYSTMPWTRAIDETRQGKHSAIIGASAEDAADFIFPTASQGFMNNHLYVKSGNPWRYNGLDSLKKVTLGAIDGYSYNEEIDSYIKKYKLDPTYVQLMSGDDALAINVSKLMREKIGLTIESKYVMNYYLSQNHLQNKIDDIASLPPSNRDNLYIAFSPKNKSLSQKYAKIMSDETKNMRVSGELQKIMDNYGLDDWETAPKK